MNLATEGKHARDSSGQSSWLSSILEIGFRRRMVIAVAAALAIHEILAGLVPWRTTTIPPEQPETLTIAKLTIIQHKPTPRPIVHVHVIAPTNVQPTIVNPGKPSENQHIRRVASARPLVKTHYHSAPARIHVPTGGHGAGSSKTAKASIGGIGTGGTGTGQSGIGTGTGGAPAAHEPCGYVDFIPYDTPTIDSSGRRWEHISLVVHFPDGSSQSTDLDYPFYYASSLVDPFVPANKNIPATFQFPPAGQSVSSPVVQYVIAHTRPDGTTVLKDCPSG
ncbi:MAG TPA: hypothetical protein VFO29_09205 [Candidatus Rubrimentiphilum sp.]|nr:hypothetical protein [Candidatus Rubrimentiphilum sp.]